jgi:hypothetical protein
MPPKSSVTAAWKVSDFGGVAPLDASLDQAQKQARQKVRR